MLGKNLTKEEINIPKVFSIIHLCSKKKEEEKTTQICIMPKNEPSKTHNKQPVYKVHRLCKRDKCEKKMLSSIYFREIPFRWDWTDWILDALTWSYPTKTKSNNKKSNVFRISTWYHEVYRNSSTRKGTNRLTSPLDATANELNHWTIERWASDNNFQDKPFIFIISPHKFRYETWTNEWNQSSPNTFMVNQQHPYERNQ